jgi:hypothetical protein
LLGDKDMRGQWHIVAGVVAVCAGLVAGPRAALPAEAVAVVALVVDTSGSVGRSGLARSKELIGGVVSALGAGSEVAVFSSTNGTFVNDRRVSHHPLAEGDVIQIGETWLQYKLEHRRA